MNKNLIQNVMDNRVPYVILLQLDHIINKIPINVKALQKLISL